MTEFANNSDGENLAASTTTRAWYQAQIEAFLRTDRNAVLGQLTSHSSFEVTPTQRLAWSEQIRILKEQLAGLQGSLFFEFNIPRMGHRIDTVLLLGPVIFVLEFKIGATDFDRASIDQVWDYALDLKNFHEASHSATIVPILIGDQIPPALHFEQPSIDHDNVCRPVTIGHESLREALIRILDLVSGDRVDVYRWEQASYRPSPTILEAARTLYARHSVEAIARYDAGAQNLTTTSQRIESILEEAQLQKKKCICFVTGVPGAGKTLVGLNVATQERDVESPTHAVFLSGNGPLVAVLREALARDEVQRQKELGQRRRKSEASREVKAFIQNVHHFRDDALTDPKPPSERVAIFDEAQRAWDLHQTAKFMRQKRNCADFSFSEPEFLLSYMDRHTDWAVIVCLVGGGQEINTGEAGIDAWLDAAKSRFSHWHMHISSRLTDSEYAAGRVLEILDHRPNAYFDECLHLSVSMRSFRAERVSDFVKALLDCEEELARRTYAQIADRYPIFTTRDLNRAKKWIRENARGTERYGLVASSKAHRLKPHAIDIRVDIDPVHWFLNDRDDTRSSFYLEDAATEFHVQGLELDWVCVAWDGDLRFSGSEWTYNSFRGDKWCRIVKPEIRKYLLNAYRVLLTRARQGMVICVPHGDVHDPTRFPTYYDTTFDYLTRLGIPQLP